MGRNVTKAHLYTNVVYTIALIGIAFMMSACATTSQVEQREPAAVEKVAPAKSVFDAALEPEQAKPIVMSQAVRIREQARLQFYMAFRQAILEECVARQSCSNFTIPDYDFVKNIADVSLDIHLDLPPVTLDNAAAGQ